MAKRFVVPFASTGDKSVTPDATDPAGAISYSQGWPSAYQLANTDPAYRPVGRQEMNGVLFDVTGAIAEIQTLGFPEWVAVTGLVTPYAINAYVRHNNIVWRNTITNNSAEPGAVGVTTWADVSTPVASTDGMRASVGLRSSATGTTAVVSVTSLFTTVKNAAGSQKVLPNLSVSISTAAAAGVGGIDAGVVAVNTWYYVHALWDGVPGSPQVAVYSLSETTPTLPPGYTHWARVGEFKTDGTANKFPLNFTHKGNRFSHKLGGNVTNMPLIAGGAVGNIAGTPAGWVTASLAGIVPPTATVIHFLMGVSIGSGTLVCAPNPLFGGVGSGVSTPMIVSGGAAAPTSMVGSFLIEAPFAVYFASNQAASTMNSLGWESNL